MEEEIKEEEQKTEEEQKEAEVAESAEEVEAEAEEKVEEVPEDKETLEEAVGAAEEEKPAEIEEEAKPPSREKKAEEEEIVEERIYTIPLGKAWIAPPNRRTPRAMRMIRSFVTKHMKLEVRGKEEEEEEPKRLIVSNEVNERVWSRGIEKPPRKIRVRVAKDKEGNVTVYLAEGD